MQFLCCESEPIKNNKLKKVEIKEKIIEEKKRKRKRKKKRKKWKKI